MRNLEIVESKNKDFMFKLLCLKLKNNTLKRWKNEKYYIITSTNNILYGISRIITHFTEEEKIFLKKDIYYSNFDFQEEEFNKLVAFFGVWVSPDIRGMKYGQKLINKRSEHITSDNVIISDVRCTSPLLKYYKNLHKMKEINKTETHYYLKN
jgi:predicted GNAT family N-acyltransferase